MKWPQTVPPVALGVLAVALLAQPNALLLLVYSVALLGAVTGAVHHSEVIAQRVGEPFGTLVLALSVTVIETALILSVMLAGGDDSAAVAPDAIFSAVMIICNGVVGLCLLVGGLLHREQQFRIEGTGSGLAALAVLCTLVLIEPTFTVSGPVAVAATVAPDLPVTLGLEPTQIALLALTFIVGAFTLGSGRTNMMQGAIHLIVFAAFLLLTLVP